MVQFSGTFKHKNSFLFILVFLWNRILFSYVNHILNHIFTFLITENKLISQIFFLYIYICNIKLKFMWYIGKNSLFIHLHWCMFRNPSYIKHLIDMEFGKLFICSSRKVRLQFILPFAKYLNIPFVKHCTLSKFSKFSGFCIL